MPNFKMASKMATTRVNVTTIHRVNWLHCSETRTISARLVLNTRGPGSQIEFISSVHVFVCLSASLMSQMASLLAYRHGFIWFLARRLFSSSPKLSYKEIHVRTRNKGTSLWNFF